MSNDLNKKYIVYTKEKIIMLDIRNGNLIPIEEFIDYGNINIYMMKLE